MKYLASRLAGFFIAATLLLSSLLGYGTPSALAAVGLTSFEVAPGNSNRELVVTWTTETEVDTVAFRLKRATVQDPNAAADVVTLPALGAGVGGGSYEHTDTGLTSGTRYYYWLYEITSSGDVTLLTAPINAIPGQTGPTNTATPTATARPTTALPTATSPATATPTTRPAGNVPANNTPTPTFTPLPTNTPVATNTPVPTNNAAAAAAAGNTPAPTNAPQSVNTPESPDQTTPATNSTDSVAPDSAPAAAPLIEGETTPEINADSGERTEQGVDALTTPAPQDGEAAPTDLTSVDTPTAQAVAENNPQVTAAASDSQPTVARPTATPRPSRSDSSGSSTGLLAVIGGGSLLAAAVLALVAFFIWRRR